MQQITDETWIEETKEIPVVDVPDVRAQINADFYTLGDLNEFMPDA